MPVRGVPADDAPQGRGRSPTAHRARWRRGRARPAPGETSMRSSRGRAAHAGTAGARGPRAARRASRSRRRPRRPARIDMDRDGLGNAFEQTATLTNPRLGDTDRDGVRTAPRTRTRTGCRTSREQAAGTNPRRRRHGRRRRRRRDRPRPDPRPGAGHPGRRGLHGVPGHERLEPAGRHAAGPLRQLDAHRVHRPRHGRSTWTSGRTRATASRTRSSTARRPGAR